jgi:hypothetical protein
MRGVPEQSDDWKYTRSVPTKSEIPLELIASKTFDVPARNRTWARPPSMLTTSPTLVPFASKSPRSAGPAAAPLRVISRRGSCPFAAFSLESR